MRGDYAVFWFVGLGVALLISILTARSNSQRANREQADRIKAQGEIRQKNDELSELRQTHARTLAAVELQYSGRTRISPTTTAALCSPLA